MLAVRQYEELEQEHWHGQGGEGRARAVQQEERVSTLTGYITNGLRACTIY